MIKSQGYNEKRRKLARICADTLGLKEVPLELMNLAIKRSDIPEKVDGNGIGIAQSESSLLSMGVVYSYGNVTKFIARDGHTYILPYNNIVLGELEKCGYVVCPYGGSSPCSYTYGDVSDEDVFGHMEKKESEKEFREKATLPSALVEQVVQLEGETIPSCDLQRDEEGKYIYDVFSDGLYSGEDYSLYMIQTAVDFYGYDNEVVRKLMGINGYGEVNLTTLDYGVNDLSAFVDYAMQNEFMNSDLYYGERGPYYSFVFEESLTDSDSYGDHVVGSTKKN